MRVHSSSGSASAAAGSCCKASWRSLGSRFARWHRWCAPSASDTPPSSERSTARRAIWLGSACRCGLCVAFMAADGVREASGEPSDGVRFRDFAPRAWNSTGPKVPAGQPLTTTNTSTRSVQKAERLHRTSRSRARSSSKQASMEAHGSAGRLRRGWATATRSACSCWTITRSCVAAVRELLEAEADIEVVGEADTAERALARIPRRSPMSRFSTCACPTAMASRCAGRSAPTSRRDRVPHAHVVLRRRSARAGGRRRRIRLPVEADPRHRHHRRSTTRRPW